MSIKCLTWSSLALGVVALVATLNSEVVAQDLVYVKRATREETRVASMTASGLADLGGKWQLIGPFDNAGHGLSAEFPPEHELKFEARYPGLGEEAYWREAAFADGQPHQFTQFKQARHATCYLYRRIDAPKPLRVRVSLGSDDGIALWLNGKRLVFDNANRAVAADQDFANLDLVEGQNDLLLKISNNDNNSAFYFDAAPPATLASKLDARLDDDFPPEGEAAHYRIVTLPLPDSELIEGGGMAFRPDGSLLVGTRRGEIWLIKNPTSNDVDKIEITPFYRGLHEILGLTLIDGKDLYLVQRPEITRVRDTDGDDVADEFTTICDKFGCSGDYHEYIFGPARDGDGNFFVTLNVGFGGGHQSKVPYRGFCLKVTPQGKMIPWAYGLRSPNGVNFSPDGRLYYCDNQGEWVGACKMHEIRQGEFYGHMASVRWWPGKKEEDRPEMTPPVLWFPYSMSQSTSEPVWDSTEGKFGPFAGQAFIGELTSSLIMRANLEEIKGRMQGAVFMFRKDFMCGVNRLKFAPDGSLFVAQTNRGWGSRGGAPHGLQRVVWRGTTPMEVHSMTVTPTGWDLRFTKPAADSAADASNYFLRSYTYNHWATYGSPEIEQKQNAVTSARLSADRMTASLVVPQRDKRRVFHLNLKNIKATSGDDLLHADAYYTLNETPD